MRNQVKVPRIYLCIDDVHSILLCEIVYYYYVHEFLQKTGFTIVGTDTYFCTFLFKLL